MTCPPVSKRIQGPKAVATYERTLENSVDGDMTKLSFVLDHEIRCCMLMSSNMLHSVLAIVLE